MLWRLLGAFVLSTAYLTFFHKKIMSWGCLCFTLCYGFRPAFGCYTHLWLNNLYFGFQNFFLFAYIRCLACPFQICFPLSGNSKKCYLKFSNFSPSGHQVVYQGLAIFTEKNSPTKIKVRKIFLFGRNLNNLYYLDFKINERFST